MPMLVTNLGCEMAFILEQRLIAQDIPLEKSSKVSRVEPLPLFSFEMQTDSRRAHMFGCRSYMMWLERCLTQVLSKSCLNPRTYTQ